MAAELNLELLVLAVQAVVVMVQLAVELLELLAQLTAAVAAVVETTHQLEATTVVQVLSFFVTLQLQEQSQSVQV